MGGCSHDCATCSSQCSEREKLYAKLNDLSNVKKVIGIVSGKGGVGKSLITSLLAVAMERQGKKVAILDSDITGPSIPKIFGAKGTVHAMDSNYYFPVMSKNGAEVMSLNLVLENDTDPVIWRGPMIAAMVKQFWSNVVWNDVDYMFVDMPPGTGDVPLTVFQSIPLTGIIVVTSPQELVSMIVGKAVKMAKLMHIPVLGMVENMSYIECPNCNQKISIFGDSKIASVAMEQDIKNIAKMPIIPDLASLCDAGKIEDVDDKVLKYLEPIYKTF